MALRRLLTTALASGLVFTGLTLPGSPALAYDLPVPILSATTAAPGAPITFSGVGCTKIDPKGTVLMVVGAILSDGKVVAGFQTTNITGGAWTVSLAAPVPVGEYVVAATCDTYHSSQGKHYPPVILRVQNSPAPSVSPTAPPVVVSVTVQPAVAAPVAQPAVVPPVALLAFAKTPAPTIKGVPAIGSVLKAGIGIWQPMPIFTYQWKANGQPITGATASSLRVTQALQGKRITITVTANRADYAALSLTSKATAAAGRAFTKKPTPRITGKATVGTTLKAKVAAWTPKAHLSYKWYAGNKAIAGANKASLRVTKSLVGKRLTVVVKGTKTGYLTTLQGSKATAKVVK